MQDWFKSHPGGQFTIATPLTMPRRKSKSEFTMLSREEAHHHFKETLADSKWKVIRGFHVLRHSFGAICTRAGVPMNVIAKWMGHTHREMMQAVPAPISRRTGSVDEEAAVVTYLGFGFNAPPLDNRRYSWPGMRHLPDSGSFSHSIRPSLHQRSRIV